MAWGFAMKKTNVIVLKAVPESILTSYEELLKLGDYKQVFSKSSEVILKLNLSWSLFFPSCSSPPWQVEGVVRVLLRDGFKIFPVENQTVVTHPWKGAYLNKWLGVLEKYGLDFIPLPNVEWIKYEPKCELRALNNLFGDEILIPKMFIGRNVMHLATLKTHGHTIITGAIKNAFGGLIPKYRHHAHKCIHEVLVDLLKIQLEIHTGIFAVIDGTVAGDGAGPRTMTPKECDLIIGGADQVAVDAVCAKIMGFDPMNIDFLRMAHEEGLGCADLDAIDIVGDVDVKKLNYKFKTRRSPVVFFDQLLRKRLAKYLPFVEKLVFHTPLFKLAILGSAVYHDYIWYPLIGRRRVKKFLKTKWGKLWLNYPYGKYPENAYLREWDPY